MTTQTLDTEKRARVTSPFVSIDPLRRAKIVATLGPASAVRRRYSASWSAPAWMWPG